MKSFVLLLMSLTAVIGAYGQAPITVLEQHSTHYVPRTDNDGGNASYKKGDKVLFDQYYSRRSGMQVDSLLIQVGQYEVVLKPTSNNEFFWKEIGNWYPFEGEARVLSCRIGYAKWKANEKADNYDLNLYHASEQKLTKPDEILATRSFYGYQIRPATILDSFTLIEFKTSDYTQVKNGFLLTVALQDVTPFADSTDELSVYSSLRGDGNGEKAAMVRTDASSLIASRGEYVRLDEAFVSGSGGYYEFDYDIMMVPILDVEAGVGYINMKGATFNGHFPNPAKDRFTIDLDITEGQDNFKVQVQTMGGHIISTHNTGYLPRGKHFINIDIPGLAAGNYVYVIESDRSSVAHILTVAE